MTEDDSQEKKVSSKKMKPRQSVNEVLEYKVPALKVNKVNVGKQKDDDNNDASEEEPDKQNTTKEKKRIEKARKQKKKILQRGNTTENLKRMTSLTQNAEVDHLQQILTQVTDLQQDAQGCLNHVTTYALEMKQMRDDCNIITTQAKQEVESLSEEREYIEQRIKFLEDKISVLESQPSQVGEYVQVENKVLDMEPVSYTHLTLPTILLV